MWQHQAEPAIPQLQPVALAVPQPAVLLEASAVRAGDLDADQAGRPDKREISHAQVDQAGIMQLLCLPGAAELRSQGGIAECCGPDPLMQLHRLWSIHPQPLLLQLQRILPLPGHGLTQLSAQLAEPVSHLLHPPALLQVHSCDCKPV